MDHIENGILGANYSSTERYKSSPIHYGLWGENFYNFLIFYFALNIMKLTYVNQIYKGMFPMKNGLNRINILYAGLHKFSMGESF